VRTIVSRIIAREPLYVAALLIAILGCRDITAPESESAPVFITASDSTPSAPFLAMAGDIAGCGVNYKDEVTALLVDSLLGTNPLARAVAVGDVAYMHGSAKDFLCYDASWGRFKAQTWAVPGNHEYNQDTSATGYYDYFLGKGVNTGRMGTRGRGYYAFDCAPGWRCYGMNGQRRIPEQTTWLAADLALHPTGCQLLWTHEPIYTSGAMPAWTKIRPWMVEGMKRALDVVVTGHQHVALERTARIRPNLTLNAPLDAAVIDTVKGARHFIAGGGGDLDGTEWLPTPKTYSEKRLGGLGILKLTLLPGHYTWEFLDVTGRVLDSGDEACR
jgi:acid phosphatase type 7